MTQTHEFIQQFSQHSRNWALVRLFFTAETDPTSEVCTINWPETGSISIVCGNRKTAHADT